jgi:hypothetical protein
MAIEDVTPRIKGETYTASRLVIHGEEKIKYDLKVFLKFPREKNNAGTVILYAGFFPPRLKCCQSF